MMGYMNLYTISLLSNNNTLTPYGFSARGKSMANLIFDIDER